MAKFRKKPIEIEAVQFLGGVEINGYRIPKGVCFCSDGDDRESGTFEHRFHLHTIHKGQIVVLEHGDWIIPESDGEHFYPCKPAVFAATYDPVLGA